MVSSHFFIHPAYYQSHKANLIHFVNHHELHFDSTHEVLSSVFSTPKIASFQTNHSAHQFQRSKTLSYAQYGPYNNISSSFQLHLPVLPFSSKKILEFDHSMLQSFKQPSNHWYQFYISIHVIIPL